MYVNRVFVFLLFVSCGILPYSCVEKGTKSTTVSSLPEKELLLPDTIWMVLDNNDFNIDTCEYAYSRSLQSENLALFWHRDYGVDPMMNPDTIQRFDPKRAILECERFYKYYVDELKLVTKGASLTDKYKLLIFVIGGDEHTAFGGGADEKVGVLWTPAVRISQEPFGALAHEMGHSFQYLSEMDYGTGPKGPIMEMSAQYMLWQVYPEWMTFENYHLEAFLKKTHFAFLHPQNMYHSPYVLEYWSQKHGKDFFGRLSHETKEGEDPVTTYKRITGITQEQFNDEIFDACRRFVTWDLPRVEEVAKPYRNMHRTKLIDEGNNRYRVDSLNCPQKYGYNGIQLEVPEAGTQIEVDFEGVANAEGYSSVKVDKAGWRYGFVAYLKNGKRVYSKMYKDKSGKVSFKVPEETTFLWLVISGAPTEHWPIVFNWGAPQTDNHKEEQWAYKFQLFGTRIVKSSLPS